MMHLIEFDNQNKKINQIMDIRLQTQKTRCSSLIFYLMMKRLTFDLFYELN